MGEAKRKLKLKEQNWLESKKFTSRFNSIKEFPAFTYSENTTLHSIKAYHHLMRLIFIRAKHLNKSIVESIESNNSYTSFILLKAHWENVAMFAYMYLGAENYIKQEEYLPLLEWVRKHALGGKKWPSDELIEKKGMKREDFQQTNLLTWMEKMDKDFDKNVGGSKKMSEFEKVYDEFIAEAGHSTFLGLSICEQKQGDGSVIPVLDKTYQIYDDDTTLNHFSISNLYFFYYWDKFCEHEEEQLKIVTNFVAK